MKTFCFCLLSVIIVAGCVRTQHSRYRGKALRVDDPIYNVRAVKMADSSVKLSFIGSPTLRTEGRKVGWVEVVIGPTEDAMNDTIPFNTVLTGAPGSEETVQLVGEADWQTPAARSATQAVMDVHVLAGDIDHLVFRAVKDFELADPMELSPFTIAVSDTQIDIGVMARRIFVPPGEYLPSSENFRVVISDENGRVVFRSDANQSFLPFISLVEPQVIGQMQRFVYPWTGKDMTGQTVSSGSYRAELIIPAHPNPYRASIDVPWPPK
jgi:hypothetical protein